MNYDFDWSILWEEPHRNRIIEGLQTTLQLSLLAWVLALSLGILIGSMRMSNSRFLRIFGSAYVELFRNIPLLLQLFIWFFVFPLLLPRDWMLSWNRMDNVPFLTALIGLSLFTSARVAEQMRSGISSIPKGLLDAASSTGLSNVQTYRYIVIPYAFRVMIPAISSEFLTIFKNSALTLTIGVAEITNTSRAIEAWSFRGIEAYSVASLTYMATTASVVIFMSWLEQALRIPGLIGRR
ncbi:MAG: amino acid ABC transporter permease [Rhodobacterales bacterium]|jgi:glutamate/aspartate transport system permease protein|tara:strand:- start:3131 stop:3844 length:714 start_codon:yes stop_codon:yes gene_type:complete